MNQNRKLLVFAIIGAILFGLGALLAFYGMFYARDNQVALFVSGILLFLIGIIMYTKVLNRV